MGRSALWTAGGHRSGTSANSSGAPQKQRISIWVRNKLIVSKFSCGL